MIGDQEVGALHPVCVSAAAESKTEAAWFDKGLALRYRVFSEELGYEPPNARRRESDEFDTASTHCALYADLWDTNTGNMTRELVSYFRLVNARNWKFAGNGETPSKPIPLTKVNGVDLSRKFKESIYAADVSEMSRVCVHPEKKCISISHDNDASPTQLRINLLHMNLMWRESLAQGDAPRYLAGITEPWYIRQLRICGYDLKTIGEPVEYHGKRQPFILDMQSEQNRKVTAVIDQKFRGMLSPLLVGWAGRINEPIPEVSAEPAYRLTGPRPGGPRQYVCA